MDISFDRRVVRLDAVKKAAYRLSETATVQIRIDGEAIHCSVSAAPGSAGLPEQLVHQFQSTVLDEDLREQIAERTAPLRTAILAMAFAPLTKKSAD